MLFNQPLPWSTARAILAGIHVVPLAIILWLGGCNPSRQQTLVDSENRRFSAQFGKDGRLTLTPEAVQPALASKQDSDTLHSFSLTATGRLVGVCGPLLTNSPPNIANCRPLVCKSDADCPPAQGLTRGVCINQLCTEPSHAIVTDDAVLLCLAGTGTGPRTALQVERLALGVNCGTPCQIPKPCRPF